MQKLSLLFTLIFSFSIGGFSIQTSDSLEIVSSDTIITESVISELDLDSIDFVFKNHKDSLTLEPFKTGELLFSWKNTGVQPKIFRYKKLNEDQWESIDLIENQETIEFDTLNENIIFDYEFVSGDAIKGGHFNTFSNSIFSNFSAKNKTEAGHLFWAIELDDLNTLLSVYPDAKYIIKYNTKIGKKQNETYPDVSPWVVEETSINKVKHKLKDLTGGESYVYKVGLQLEPGMIVWSKEGKFTADRSWGVFKLLVLIGSLGMFIFGMKIMSEGLQKAAGARLRNMLGSITSNRVSGVLTGFGITSIVQSSSVTTVMTVSFVNAGLLTLRQSAGVMMGANIGTTLTAWLILIFGFKVSLSDYAYIFIAFGAPLLFFSKGKAKTWASVIIGFSLLFMGLGALKDSVPELGPESDIVQFFIDFKDVWYGPLMFVFLGALVTVVIQSSSAAMALTMTMVAGGVIPFEVASAMILGENIGTTITAELASLVGNVHAKRSARIHSLFNLIGVTWAILLFPFILDLINALFVKGDPYSDGEAANTALAIFHSLFNTLNVLILLPFVPWLVRMAEKTVKSRGGADEEFHLDYIGTGMMGTPDMSILEAKKEVAKFGEITSRMSSFTQDLLTEQNKKKKGKLHEKIEKYEVITDRVEVEVASYLAKVSEGEMSETTAERVRAMNSIVNDLERIGDVFYQMSKAIERKEEHKIWFIPEQRTSLMEMFTLVDKAFTIMIDNLNADWEGVSIDPAKAAENAINRKRDEMREEHLNNLKSSDFNMESGMIFNNLFSSCEKVGDHIINVSEAITGRI
ncbi:MAG: Na/Pi cotransporter family protein [Crocinitomicaceae bacterium]